MITQEKTKKKTISELMMEDDTSDIDCILNYSSYSKEQNRENGWYTTRKKTGQDYNEWLD